MVNEISIPRLQKIDNEVSLKTKILRYCRNRDRCANGQIFRNELAVDIAGTSQHQTKELEHK